MGDRFGTFDSQTILEQCYLAATDCSILTGRAGLTAIGLLSFAILPTQEQTSCRERYCACTNQAKCKMNVCNILILEGWQIALKAFRLCNPQWLYSYLLSW